MAGARRRTGLPRLAYVYHPTSFPTFTLSAAAEGLCELIWVVDHTILETQDMARLLARLGTVVDIAEMGDEQAAEAIGRHDPAGILTLADARLTTTARLSELLGLSFFSSKTTSALTDKFTQRQALAQGGLEVPRYAIVPALEDAKGWERLGAEAVFPAVLKPRIGEASRDTFRVESLKEARVLAEQSEAERPGRGLVLEEYLRDGPGLLRPAFGHYVSVECVVSRGVVYPVAVTGRFPPAEPFRETGFFIPAALEEDLGAAVIDAACRSAKALAITQGCLHIEIKLTPDGPRVIEVNGRLGGGMSEMLTIAAGIDLYPVALRLALGEDVRFDGQAHCSRVGWLLYVHAPWSTHTITGLEGIDALANWPEVKEVVVNRGVGNKVDWREGNHGHVFSVLGEARDHDQLIELERRVHEEVQIDGI